MTKIFPPFPQEVGAVSCEDFYEQESLNHNLYLNLCLGDTSCPGRNKDWADLGIVFPITEYRRPYVVWSRLIELVGDYKTARTMYILSQYPMSSLDFLAVDLTKPSLMDYRMNYSPYLEFAKLSLIKSFSVFDKIATFLNEYEMLGIPDRRVRYWRHPNQQAQTVFEHNSSQLMRNNPDNMPLKALESISIELRDEHQLLIGVRNSLVHHYVVFHVFGPLDSHSYPLSDPEERIMKDLSGEHSPDNPIHYHVLLDDFHLMVLHALKLARVAVLYTIRFVQSKENPKLHDLTVAPGPAVSGIFR
ncbi:MAG: hypothetical protein DRP01_10210 [Archaeoglobales archaeon]|nr:MAG: hypothetical protein DRP01_10210 [Archaeoglobales archaeon]